MVSKKLISARGFHRAICPTRSSAPTYSCKKSEGIALVERIKKGESFSKLAQELSIDKGSGKRGGDLGYFTRGMMVKPFEEAAFKLEKGQMSEPVKTEFGYHLIKRVD